MNIRKLVMFCIGTVLMRMAVLAGGTVSGVKAQQRYPWNGKVDIDCTLSGDSGQSYDLKVSARDKVGGTNLTVSTVSVEGGDATGNLLSVVPGTYRLVWDAGIDLPNGFNCERVTVDVNATIHTNLYAVIDLSAGSTAASYSISYLDKMPSDGWTDEYKTTKLVLRYIPNGSFLYQGTIRTNIATSFYIGIFEMTQKQLSNLGVSARNFNGKGDVNAASGIYDLHALISTLNGKLNMVDFVIPSEVEWEYACKAGTSTELNSGKELSVDNMNEVGRCQENRSGLGPTAVGSFLPNNWGLYDMHGNVWEFCNGEGGWSYRGGGWNYSYVYCTSENRDFSHPSYNSYGISYYGGVRIAFRMK